MVTVTGRGDNPNYIYNRWSTNPPINLVCHAWDSSYFRRSHTFRFLLSGARTRGRSHRSRRPSNDLCSTRFGGSSGGVTVRMDIGRLWMAKDVVIKCFVGWFWFWLWMVKLTQFWSLTVWHLSELGEMVYNDLLEGFYGWNDPIWWMCLEKGTREILYFPNDQWGSPTRFVGAIFWVLDWVYVRCARV